MANPKTEITGEVKSVEEKQGSKNPWYIITVSALLKDWQDNTETVVFQFKAFGKVCEKVKALRQGDYVVAKCAVRSNEWKEKHYTELSLDSLEVQHNAAPIEDVASKISKEADNAMTEEGSENTSLPF
jgi:aspartyl/asparaginyl-tRNA synthetase